MRRLIELAGGSAMPLLALSACASPGPPTEARVVDIGAMDASVLGRDTPLVIHIPKGTRLPVQVTLDTPFVVSAGGDPAFEAVFERDVWWYPGRAQQISFDGTTWQEIGAGHRGQLSIGLGRDAESGAKGNVYVGLAPE